MSTFRTQAVAGLALALIALSAGVVHKTQVREQDAREAARTEAHSALVTDLTDACDELSLILLDVPASALDRVMMAPLCSSGLSAQGTGTEPLTVDVQVGSDGDLCLVVTTPSERRVLVTGVALSFGGESPSNGMDDNQNGVIDEPGFYITLLNHTLEFGLTLSRPSADGPLVRTRNVTLNLSN